MSLLKEYLKKELIWRMMLFEHSNPLDFYICVCQKPRSVLTLLLWRFSLFLFSLGITLSSVVLDIYNGIFGYWFIYLTHWGLILITVTTLFATLISMRCYLFGPLSTDFPLPWYVKVYWILFNMAVPVAFLITLFYWTILYKCTDEDPIHKVVNVLIHGCNSLVMLLLLVASPQPMRLLHVYLPCGFVFAFFLFSIIYYFAGGKEELGNPYIYPVINWSSPGPTMIYCLMTGLLLVAVFVLVVAMAAARDVIAATFFKPEISEHTSVSEGVSSRMA